MNKKKVLFIFGTLIIFFFPFSAFGQLLLEHDDSVKIITESEGLINDYDNLLGVITTGSEVAAAICGLSEMFRNFRSAGERHDFDAWFGEMAVVFVEFGFVFVDHLIKRSTSHVGWANVTAAFRAVL